MSSRPKLAVEGNFIKPTFKRESLRPIACTKPWFGLDLVDLTNPLSLKIPTGRWQLVGCIQSVAKKLNSGQLRTKPVGSLVVGLNLEPPDFKFSALNTWLHCLHFT